MDPQTQQQAVTLGTQLGVAGLSVLLMTMVHGLGLLLVMRLFNLAPENLAEREVNSRSMLRLGALGVALFALHLIEIGMFAVFYRVIGALETAEEALYFSASAYATLGRPEEGFPHEWRLMIAVEAVIGFVLISWSAAFIVSAINSLRQEKSE
ncbi:hypothetical protein [Sphingosinithalassobacter sp. LHW66-3]|uniref:hypothetical protein n=1 Tax=Sphingosinithalassobacter sp. LHW66-3 TaxID=3424718 RepID=UPI003D6A3B14